jgi:tRNA(fMet)-specific endonuclease VapC
MIYLLDTDHLTLLQRGGDAGSKIRNRLSLVAPDDYGTTIVTYEEQAEGWLAEISRAKDATQTVEAYRRLNANFRFFINISLWQFTDKAAKHFDEWRKEKIRVGTRDLRIAAIAVSNDATVLTRNRRDFERVPALRVEDWTV